jgi:hypothetical protein
MTCLEGRESIHEQFEEGLTPDRQRMVFSHLADCRDCSSFFDSILLTRAAGQREQIAYPSALDDQLLPVFQPETARSLSRQKRRIDWVRADSFSTGLAVSYPLVIFLCALMFGLGIVLKGTLSPVPARRTYPATPAVQPATVIMIYGLPPVDVQGVPAKDVLHQPSQQQE